jgi:hypothetical protein
LIDDKLNFLVRVVVVVVVVVVYYLPNPIAQVFVKWVFPIFPLVFLWLWLLEYEDFSILMRGVIVGMRVRRFLDSHESCCWYKGMGISQFS